MLINKENYKFTGIEWIKEAPSHWLESKMRYIGYLYGGLSGKSAKDFNQLSHSKNRRFIPFTNIYNNLEIDVNNLEFVVVNKNEKQNSVKKGDLFFLMSSENYEDVGKSSVLTEDVDDTYLNSFCKGFRLENKNVYPKFLNYFLSSKPVRHSLLIEANGFTRINLKIEKILNLKVLIPPYNEQLSITNYLDQKTKEIDELIADKKQLLELYEEEKIAVINQAVTKGIDPDVKMRNSGVEWLGEIPDHWDILKLKYISHMKSGDNIVSEQIKNKSTYPVYGGNGLRGYYEKYTHNGEHILIGRQGAYCGNIKYAKGKFWASEHAVVLTQVKNYDTFYLGELLKAMNLNQYSVSAAQPGLSVETIKNLYIPFPSVIEQETISDYIKVKVNLIEKKKNITQELIELLKEYKTALISEVVTGKVKVV